MSGPALLPWKRAWVPRGSLAASRQPLEALLSHHCVLLVGEPGMGKSSTLRREQDDLRRRCEALGGELVPTIDLRMFRTESYLVEEVFRSASVERWKAGDHKIFLVLDSFDECPLRESLAPLLVHEIEKLPRDRLHLLVASRPNFWSASFEADLGRLWSEGTVKAFELAPLGVKDIRQAAQFHEIDPDAFMRAVDERDVFTLASRPLPLNLLLSEFRDRQTLSSDRWELYRNGCTRLASGNGSRRAQLGAGDRVKIASRVAALMLLSGRDAVWIGSPEGGDDRRGITLDALADDAMKLADLREVLDSGLFRADEDPGLARWAHGSYAEFLAASYLLERRVPLEQIEQFLWGPGDSHAGVHPTLQGVALWMSSRWPELLERLIAVDPWILIWSDACQADPRLRARLVEILINRVDEGRDQENQFPFADSPFARLSHPELGPQLRDVLARAGERGQMFALSIGRESKERSLVPECLQIVVDGARPADLRRRALGYVGSLGSDEEKRSLISWALSGGDDQELRWTARAMLWPGHISTRQFLETASGHDALWAIRERLSIEDLPLALGWVETRPPRHLLDHGTHEVENAVLERAWKHLDEPGVFDVFLSAVRARLRRAPDIPLSDLLSLDMFTTEAKFPFGWEDHGDARRWQIVEALVMRAASVEEAARVTWTRPQLLTHQDAQALTARVEQARLPEVRSRWERVLESTSVIEGERCLAFIRKVENDPALVRYFTRVNLRTVDPALSLPIDLYSYLSPPAADWVALLMLGEEGERLWERAEASAEHWPKLVHHLRRGPVGPLRGLGTVTGVLTADGEFTTLDPTRLMPAARRFLEHARPPAEPWLDGEPIGPSMASAYDALLLVARDPSALTALPDVVWSHWSSLMLSFIDPNPAEMNLRQALIQQASAKAPVEVRKTFRRLLTPRNGIVRICAFLDGLNGSWTAPLFEAAVEAIQNTGLDPEVTWRLLERVPLDEAPGVRAAVESLLESPHERSLERRSMAAATLLERGGEPGWQRVWPLIQNDTGLSWRVLDLLDDGPEYSFIFNPLYQLGRSPQHGAEVQAWFARLVQETGDSHVQRAREILRMLTRDSSPLATAPHEQHAVARWQPLAPEKIRTLLDTPWKRLVRTGDDLLKVVLESLHRFERELHDHTSAIHSLWDQVKRGKGELFKPKSEGHLSDALKRHLQRDLIERGAVVNREVEIQPRQPTRPGQRTDLQIDAVADGAGGRERVSVILEVKGCWNPELWTAMKDQLAKRYLAESSSHHGVYVVGWFAGPHWSRIAPLAAGPTPTLEQARQILEAQATQLSQGPRRVRALVINTAFRAG